MGFNSEFKGLNYANNYITLKKYLSRYLDNGRINCLCLLWPFYSGFIITDSVQQLHAQQPSTYAKPEAASAVLVSWWCALCRPKHVQLHRNIK